MSPKSKPTSSHSSTKSSFSTNNLSYKTNRYSSGFNTGLLIGSMLNNSISESKPVSKSEPKYIEKVCPFCDRHLRVDPIVTTCPNCSGDLDYTVNNTVKNSVKNSTKTEGTVNNSVNTVNSVASTINKLSTTTQLIISLFAIFITIFIMFAFVPLVSKVLRDIDENLVVFNSTADSTVDSNITKYNNDDYIYVEPLERNVYWSDKYDCYYDEPTDCYFFKNTNLEPEIWQYWFEDISSDYGDYGWMEYDFDEDCWYIQTDDETWEEYTGSTNGLWHMNENE